MGKLIPQAVANWVVEFGNNLAQENLDDVVANILKTKMPKFSEEEIWDYIESHRNTIANELFQKIDNSIDDGINLNFQISQDGSTFYINFLNKPEIALLRKLNSITSKDFEFFCKKILDKMGGNCTVDGGKDDGGIDFTCYNLQLNCLSNIPTTKGARILVLGQSKQFTTGEQITESDLRKFVGASTKKIGIIKKTKSEQIGILHPIILAYWVTSDFQKDAKIYANEIGIWYLNGIAISQLALKLGLEI